MIYLAWGGGIMYYLMSTRAADASDNGSVNLLIWSAIKRAHELGLFFDLDGVTTSGTARFLSGFGGNIRTRLVITTGRKIYNVVESLKTIFRAGESVPSSFS
jgi:lipid II:glycine glycyltransferase (peptidoglycan interpeptide bridge formation enzyme)